MASVTLFLAGKKVGTYEMNVSPFVVGREKGCGLQIENIGVSRRHCQFLYEDGSYWVEDAGSSNGTFHGGKKIPGRLRIADGDEVNIGKYVLLFEDKGMELLPQQSGADAAAPGGGDGIGMTFQMDPKTLREQMAKAGAAAAPVAQAQRASDVAKGFDPDAPLVIKGKEAGGGHVLGTILKLLGVAIVIAGLMLGLLAAFGSS